MEKKSTSVRLPAPGTIENLAVNLMLTDMGQEEILAEIKRIRPRAQTTLECLDQYFQKYKDHLPVRNPRRIVEGRRRARPALRLVG